MIRIVEKCVDDRRPTKQVRLCVSWKMTTQKKKFFNCRQMQSRSKLRSWKRCWNQFSDLLTKKGASRSQLETKSIWLGFERTETLTHVLGSDEFPIGWGESMIGAKLVEKFANLQHQISKILVFARWCVSRFKMNPINQSNTHKRVRTIPNMYRFVKGHETMKMSRK